MYKTLILLLLASCTSPQENVPTRFEGSAMTIPYCVQVADPLTSDQVVQIEQILLTTFAEIHTIYNNWNPDSEISLLNHLPAHQVVQLSPQLAAFLAHVGELVALTEGRFDPTIEPLRQVWKEAFAHAALPNPEEIKPLYHAIGWHHIHLQETLFWKDDPHTALDLSGVAKGYGVDLITERLLDAGYANTYVEWGGEIRASGRHSSERPWHIAIHGLSTLDLADKAIATSGTYIQNWNIEGICYTHIFDPRICEPLHDCPITSASVLAPTCLDADAFATALMLFPSPPAAASWATAHGLVTFIY